MILMDYLSDKHNANDSKIFGFLAVTMPYNLTVLFIFISY